MKKLSAKEIVFCLLIIFGIMISSFFASVAFESRIFFPIVAASSILLFAFGIILIRIAKQEKGKLKKALLLTSISAISPFVFTLFHNFFYGLNITFKNVSFLFEILGVVSFLIAIFVAPITFIIGAVCSIMHFRREPKK